MNRKPDSPERIWIDRGGYEWTSCPEPGDPEYVRRDTVEQHVSEKLSAAGFAARYEAALREVRYDNLRVFDLADEPIPTLPQSTSTLKRKY